MAQRLIYIRHDTIKLLERNICKTSSNINPSNVFFSQSPRTIEIKAKVNKWNLIKLMNFCTAKEAGSYGSSNFWRNHHAIFHSNCANLHFYQQYMRFPFSLHPCQHLLFICCLFYYWLTEWGSWTQGQQWPRGVSYQPSRNDHEPPSGLPSLGHIQSLESPSCPKSLLR